MVKGVMMLLRKEAEASVVPEKSRCIVAWKKRIKKKARASALLVVLRI